jgi:hypothetical protein
VNFLSKAWAASDVGGRTDAFALFVLTFSSMIIFAFASGLLAAYVVPDRNPVLKVVVAKGLPVLPDVRSMVRETDIVREGEADGVLSISIGDGRLKGVFTHLRDPLVPSSASTWLDPYAWVEATRAGWRRSIIEDIAEQVLEGTRKEWRVLLAHDVPGSILMKPLKFVVDGVAVKPSTGVPWKAGPIQMLRPGPTTLFELVKAVRCILGGMAVANVFVLLFSSLRSKGHFEACLATDLRISHFVAGYSLLMVGAAVLVAAAGSIAFLTLSLLSAGGAFWMSSLVDLLSMIVVVLVVAVSAYPAILIAQLKPARLRSKIACTIAMTVVVGAVLGLPVLVAHILKAGGLVLGVACLLMPDGAASLLLCRVLPSVDLLPVSGFVSWMTGAAIDSRHAVASVAMGIPLVVAVHVATMRCFGRPDMIVRG